MSAQLPTATELSLSPADLDALIIEEPVYEQGVLFRYLAELDRLVHVAMRSIKHAMEVIDGPQPEDEEPDYELLCYRTIRPSNTDAEDYDEAYADVAGDATLCGRLRDGEDPREILEDVRVQVRG